jgi:Zeta toxin
MDMQKSEKPAKGATAHAGDALPARGRGLPFDLLDEADDVPELHLMSASVASETPLAAKPGVDLSGKPKIVFFVGRGKTGKTTAIRWAAERAVVAGRSLIMADMDPTNDTFAAYVADVARLSDPSDPAMALRWLNKLLQHALEKKSSLLVDLGGGDTVLRRLVAQTPDLVPMIEAGGAALVAFYTLGPQEEDLSPLAVMTGLGFRPTGTAIILNEAMAELGQTREAAFGRILRHSIFHHAVVNGAVPMWMPRLIPAQEIEIRRLPFQEAVDGRTGQAKTPLGPFDRSRTYHWLRAMGTNFKGVETWLP